MTKRHRWVGELEIFQNFVQFQNFVRP